MHKLEQNHHSAWLVRADIRRLLDLLNDAQATTRCVGGCVRDTLLMRASENTEVDMATTLAPHEVQMRLQAAGIKTLDIGIAHGTLTAICAGRQTEITTLRRDIETDGRHAKIAFTDDWHADAARRDFTINALYADKAGNVYDPTTQGLTDIAARRVRFIGDARARLAEDYLRLMRYFRFHFMVSAGQTCDGDALAACRQAVPHSARLSGERKGIEFIKILSLPAAADALQAMQSIGLLAYLIGDSAVNGIEMRLTALARLIDIYGATADVLLRLACVLPDATAIEQTTKLLRLSNAQKKRLLGAHTPFATTDWQVIERAFYWHGVDAVCDQARLTHRHDCDSILHAAQNWQKPSFPLTGDMMRAAGLAAGPQMGRTARALEQWWVDENFPDIESLRAELNRRLM